MTDRIAELKEKNDLMGSLEETLEETMRSLEDVLRDNALLCEVIGREVVHGDIGYRTVSLRKTQPLSLTSQQRKEVGEMVKRQEKLRTLMTPAVKSIDSSKGLLPSTVSFTSRIGRSRDLSLSLSLSPGVTMTSLLPSTCD
jgi:hypothetical protein